MSSEQLKNLEIQLERATYEYIGLETAFNMLMDGAKSLFASGKDDPAIILRNYCLEISKKMKNCFDAKTSILSKMSEIRNKIQSG